MHLSTTRRRLAAAFILGAIAGAAWWLSASDAGAARFRTAKLQALKAADLGRGGRLEIRPRDEALDVLLQRGEGALWRSMLVLLLAPDDRIVDARAVRLPDEHKAVRVLLRRKPSKLSDRVLRIALATGSKENVGRARVAAVGNFLVEPHILLLGDSEILAGSTYSPRIVVRGRRPKGCEQTSCAPPVSGAVVGVRLSPASGAKGYSQTATGTTDSTGSPSVELKVAAAAEGAYRLDVDVESEGGNARASYPVQIRSGARVLLSTDKPIYQPGQTVYLRLLARSRGSGKAMGRAPARLAIHDAKNNKVFQRKGRTTPQGVFAATFHIASLVNTGRWRIEAEVAGTKEEKTLEVKPYVLPKFKVELETEQASYRPGERVEGSVHARYFFGKALKGAKVELVAQTFDVEVNEVARLSFRLDDTGSHSFELRLPKVFHGQPMLQGRAAVRLVARVSDTAGQRHEASRTLTVTRDPLQIIALPEAGKLVPEVENVVFVLVTRPDGTPVEGAEVDVTHSGVRFPPIETDRTGVAEWRGVPDAGQPDFEIAARARDGSKAARKISLATGARRAVHVLLRPDDPAPKVGDRVRFDVLVSGAVPHAFLDLVRDGQTLATHSAPVEGGRAAFEVELSDNAAGTVLAHAYAIGDDMEVYADTRPVVVRPASDLMVALTPKKAEHRPGDEVALDVTVTDAKGHPVLAALGLWVVDEAVFALSELRPGMERVFFLLEKEIMKPKVEIHGFHAHETVMEPRPLKPVDEKRRRRAARVLGAAAMPAFAHALKLDASARADEEALAEWREIVGKRLERFKKRLHRWVRKKGRLPKDQKALESVLAKAGMRGSRGRDPFGERYQVVATGWIAQAELLSAGPDTTFSTADDIRVSLDLQQVYNEIEQKRWRKQRRRFARRPMARARGGGLLMMDGFGAGGGGLAEAEMAAAPMEAPAAGMGMGDVMKAASPPRTTTATDKAKKQTGGAAPPRLRSWFPETLYVNPLILTDEAGRATVRFPGADSITTWRMSALASTAEGLLGSTDQGLKVFQDFFVDLDLPVSLTRGDEVAVPLAAYNYLKGSQTVALQIETEGGVEVLGEDQLSLDLDPGEVRGVAVRLRANRVGHGRITVTARGSKMSDAVRRRVRVVPDGFPVVQTRSGMLAGRTDLSLEVPGGAIPHASTLQIKLYPGMFSQVVDGLEGMLRMPSGCFEQTSSSTYPNILVLRYLRDAKKSKPELEAKALRFLQAGWQRLVTYEVKGGGFSWFGSPPANGILTAYGLMEFFDMDKVMDIDEKVVARTRRWLLKRQKGDGSFKPDASFLHQESWGDIQKSTLLVSAYITWSLAYTRPDRGSLDRPLQRSISYLKEKVSAAKDPYELVYLANAMAEAAADRKSARAERRAARAAIDALAVQAVRKGKELHWETKLRTATYGSGESANIEVTALALRAIMRAGYRLDLVKPGLAWLVGAKSQWGHWHSTQATIQVLQALVASLSTSTEPTEGTVLVHVNGEQIEAVRYGMDDFDVVRFVDASKHLKEGANEIRLEPSGSLQAMYTATATAYLPWRDPRRPAKQAFEVDVAYDRTRLAKDDKVRVDVTVKSNLPGIAKMGIVDLGVPPGFTVIPDALEAAVEKGVLQRYTLAGRQIILYVAEFDPKKPLKVRYDLRARFPVRVATGAARAYEYYDPANVGLTPPSKIVVE